MALAMALLGLVGFVFPPAWLGAGAIAIYLFASRASRRNEAIETRVGRMVSAKRDFAIFNDLYFEAARSYAVSKGAKAAEANAASARIVVDGNTYFVVFSRATNGGTAMSVREERSVLKEIERGLPEELRTYR